MKELYKVGIMWAAIVSAPLWFCNSLRHAGASNQFHQGLQFKVEEIADSDKNGALSVDEMVAVCKTLGEDPAKRLREGFYLSVDDCQTYLKATGQFDPKVDAAYQIGNAHPYFEKAEAEGKPIRSLSF